VSALSQDSRPCQPVTRPFRALLRVPGSKSITNRLYVLAALSEGVSWVRHPLRADDTDRLLLALNQLGVPTSWEGDAVRFEGQGGVLPRGGQVDLGDGGTPTRFLLALATLARGAVVIDGSARMRERPIDEGIELLRSLGASIRARRDASAAVERLPVTVEPTGPLRGGVMTVGRTASSQFLSALLLIAPTMREALTLRYTTTPTSESYLDLTIDALRSVGVDVAVERDDARNLLAHRASPSPIAPFDRTVEPDASSVAYAAVAAALVPGAEVILEGIPATSVQPDLELLDALAAMGASVERRADRVVVGGRGELRPFEGDASRFPDASLALAVACARAKGRSVITGLRTLRVKESDRIAALATELTRIGCRCETTDDSLTIDPVGVDGRPARIETYRDHRIAMSFAALSAALPGLTIADPGCVAKSYPGFWEDFERTIRSAPHGTPAAVTATDVARGSATDGGSMLP
jgi:3-phosphoshikimate 1-carboxyvinyltransferase